MSFEGWKEVRLSEVMEIVGGGTPKSSVDEYWNGSIPWLSVKDFNNDFRKVYTTEKTITELGLSNSSTKLLNKGDLIISARGTVGVLAQLGKPMAFNQSCYGLRAKPPITNDFLYYLLKSNMNHLRRNTHGSVFDTITRGTFDSIEVDLPPEREQKKIASILSSLDEKIELNHQINQNLEEMAQAIFKSWFVDFEPFQDGEFVESELGMIPKGWEVKSLDEIAHYLNGLAMQKYRPTGEDFLPVIKIKELRQGYTTSDSDKATPEIDNDYIVNDGDVLFSWSGTLKVKVWCGGKGALNQHLFKVTSKKYEKWFYYYWTKFHLERFRRIAEDRATTMGHIRRKDLSDSKVLIPEQDSLEKLSTIIKPVFDQIVALEIQSRKLKRVRDTLLPKLMSGEIRVPLEDEEAI